ncbi:hypothetical protein KL953_14945 [Mycolicibacterium goodii]|uniref:hypothetical protein n=1 Tax=Mycolicibacterium goodii TaxID=134601 RepID=UPI001BDD14B0|nr:hypothetical protein [Mycolicibacterium goodii]MBU8810182.1 hypothetical protein [Mycolicibacterium goodii]
MAISNDITLMINGGYHGLAERTEYYIRGLQMSRLPRTHVAVLYIGCLARGAITACATPPQNTGAPETLTPVPLSTSLSDKSCRPKCGLKAAFDLVELWCAILGLNQ